MALKKISGIVLLTSICADSENPDRIGLSFRSQDEQDIHMEVAVSSKNAEGLKVDGVYRADFEEGETGKGAAFKIFHLNEVDFGNRYDERMVTKGEIEGHINMLVKPEQEDVFFEEKTYTLTLSEVVAE